VHSDEAIEQDRVNKEEDSNIEILVGTGRITSSGELWCYRLL